MNEPNEHSSVLDLGAEDAGAAISSGALLRDAREAAGVHVAALAAALKVPVNKLQALEADDFAALPDAVFARALAASVCRTLRLDPAPVLALMPKNTAPSFSAASPGINASFKDGSEKARQNPLFAQAMRPVGLAVIVLLLGALALVLLPRGGDLSASATHTTGSALQEPEAKPGLVLAPPAVVAPESAAVSSPEPLTSRTLGSSGAVAEAPATADPVEVAPALVVAPAAADLLEFRARSDSWVQVRDAAGTVVLQRTLAKGESASATGTLPLTVVVGRADATDVFVRGSPFALARVAKENVARFEVKQ